MLLDEKDQHDFWRVMSEHVVGGIVTEGKTTSDASLEGALHDQDISTIGFAMSLVYDFAETFMSNHCCSDPMPDKAEKYLLACLSWMEATASNAPSNSRYRILVEDVRKSYQGIKPS